MKDFDTVKDELKYYKELSRSGNDKNNKQFLAQSIGSYSKNNFGEEKMTNVNYLNNKIGQKNINQNQDLFDHKATDIQYESRK